MHKHPLLALTVVMVCAAASAQTLYIGFPGDTSTATASDMQSAATRTDISLSPAWARGTISTVHLYWSASGCPNAFKIKFFRRYGNDIYLGVERGPFSSSSGNETLTMSPPVQVNAGDLIGVARLTNCGGPGVLDTITADGYLQYAGEVTTSTPVDATAGVRSRAPLLLIGLGSAESWVAGMIPVVGSLAGSFGSNFKTEVQFMNTANESGMVSLVFHQQSTAGRSDDPQLSFLTPAGHVATYADAVASMGMTGIGSIDVWVPVGHSMPAVVARVYNDGGTSGTTGLSEDIVKITDDRHLQQDSTAFLIMPANPAKARFNIGVRTHLKGVEFTATLMDAFGGTLKTIAKTYPPQWFEQASASDFFGGATFHGSEVVRFEISSGSAIIYGSTTDNITNDPAMQFARKAN